MADHPAERIWTGTDRRDVATGVAVMFTAAGRLSATSKAARRLPKYLLERVEVEVQSSGPRSVAASPSNEGALAVCPGNEIRTNLPSISGLAHQLVAESSPELGRIHNYSTTGRADRRNVDAVCGWAPRSWHHPQLRHVWRSQAIQPVPPPGRTTLTMAGQLESHRTRQAEATGSTLARVDQEPGMPPGRRAVCQRTRLPVAICSVHRLAVRWFRSRLHRPRATTERIARGTYD